MMDQSYFRNSGVKDINVFGSPGMPYLESWKTPTGSDMRSIEKTIIFLCLNKTYVVGIH